MLLTQRRPLPEIRQKRPKIIVLSKSKSRELQIFFSLMLMGISFGMIVLNKHVLTTELFKALAIVSCLNLFRIIPIKQK